MIDVYFWPTPNGHKVTIFLEEAAVPYKIVPVNIGRGEQFEPKFLAISPNNRMPAIIDDSPADGGAPLSVFESAAILQYLAEKHGVLLPKDIRGKMEVLEWVSWQVANVGPVFGQLGHFKNYATEKLPYAIDRFTNEVHRLCGVLESQLTKQSKAGKDWVAGDYSIADIAIYPWTKLADRHGMEQKEFPRVFAWLAKMAARPAVIRALEKGSAVNANTKPMDEEARKILFGQRARTTTTA